MNLVLISLCLIVITVCTMVFTTSDNDSTKATCSIISGIAGVIIGYCVAVPFI